MDINEIKEKVAENKVPVASVLIALAALGAWYVRCDALVETDALRVKADEQLTVLKFNDTNSKSLEEDLSEAKALYGKIGDKALDFDNGLHAQSFFSDLLNSPGVKFEGIPSLVAAPLMLASKPFATGSYVIRAEGGVPEVLVFCKKCEETTVRLIHVERLQLTLGADKKSVATDIAVRTWGRRGELAAPVVTTPAGKILAKTDRRAKIEAATGSMRASVSLAGINHLIGGDSSSVAVIKPIAGLETAIKALKISTTTIFGQKAIHGGKIGVKREGNTFELTVDGTPLKVTVVSISGDVVTFSAGTRTLKISLTK